MDGEVVVEIEASVARVTLANPARRNAITFAMYEQLEEGIARIDADPAVRAVVLRGAGGEAFAAGSDIREFAEFKTGDDGLAYERRISRIFAAVAGLRMPVVAVVEGPAAGAGLALAACSDIVIATPDATFGAPIARTLGNCLAPPLVARLQSRLGAARAMRMLLTATMLTADEAAESGFVSQLVPRDELDAAVEALVTRLCDAAPLTLAAFKEIDRRLAAATTVDADDILRTVYSSADFAEGVRAFTTHRPPHWQAR